MFIIPTAVQPQLPLGTYSCKLVGMGADPTFKENAKNPANWQSVPKHPGLYVKADQNQAILRWQVQDGDFKGTIFSQYVSQIDLDILLADCKEKLKIESKEVPAVLTAMATTPINLYRFKELGLAKDKVSKQIFIKWGHKKSQSAVPDDYTLEDAEKETAEDETARENLQ